MHNTITKVEGVKVGHAQDINARTGCTVVIFDNETDVACDARGGWPGTYDTDSIGIGKTFVKKHAVFLTGGDVFGLDVATGVRRFLIEQGLAARKGSGKLPGIVGANIYDVEFADTEDVNYQELGYAASAAATNMPAEEGNVGAGTGATVGKFLGRSLACKGGVGSDAIMLSNGIIVGSIVITNAVGNIYDSEECRLIAGARGEKSMIVPFEEIAADYVHRAAPKHNTTIGVVATNVDLSHEELIRVAQVAHDGLAISIRPAHMTIDGDTIFAASTARLSGFRGNHNAVDTVAFLSGKCVAQAVVRSVRAARTLSGVPGWGNF
jgi:L-aminopeptidase/D-esterase-like protein